MQAHNIFVLFSTTSFLLLIIIPPFLPFPSYTPSTLIIFSTHSPLGNLSIISFYLSSSTSQSKHILSSVPKILSLYPSPVTFQNTIFHSFLSSCQDARRIRSSSLPTPCSSIFFRMPLLPLFLLIPFFILS